MSHIKKYQSKHFSNIDAPFMVEQKYLTTNQPIHWHDFFEIEYMVSGSGEYIINGEQHSIKNNIMFLSTPSDFHEIYFTSETEIINVQFSAELINRNLYTKLTVPIITEDESLIYHQLLQLLCSYGPLSNHYNQQFIENMLNSLLFLICSNKNSVSVKNHNDVSNYFHKMLIYINEHFQEQISLSDLSQKFHLHPEYISKLFKKNSNQTFSEYLTETRLSHACQLLKLDDISISDIAIQSGYTSSTHFIRMFKKKYGYPPNQFRKKSKNS